jgi:alpha-tubulin suppressor-like RCC1 family protein
VRDLPGWSVSDLNASQLIAGMNHFCALTKDQLVRCWGGNHHGQIGDGGAGIERALPSQVAELPGKVAQIGSGSMAFHTCAILTDGSLSCWGRNDSGQLGSPGAPEVVSTPITVEF